jgi:hypothetical protein
MDWASRLREEEARLKSLVERLGKAQGNGLRSRVERSQLSHALSRRLSQTRSFLDDCLSGRNEYEKALMQYRVRVEFPMYCHLQSIFSISEDPFEDRTCA